MIPRFAIVLLTALLVGNGQAAARQDPVGEKLLIGTKHSPPFAFQKPDGSWTGISIELFRHVMDELEFDYEFRPLPLEQLLKGLQDGELDAAVAAISVTANRARDIDFCHPHFTTGLGIAVASTNRPGMLNVLRRMVTSGLLTTITVMVAFVLGCGVLFWVFERRRNHPVFGDSRKEGIGMGLWWSTILLLGHKGIIPVSLMGRILATSAILVSILLLSLLTGIIASVLTVDQLESGIQDPGDLRYVRTATVVPSSSADYLARQRIEFQSFPDLDSAIEAVIEKRMDAVVYDEPLLKYLARSRFGDSLEVLPLIFNSQDYAFALPAESPLRKPLNEKLLEFRADDRWDKLLFKFLGS